MVCVPSTLLQVFCGVVLAVIELQCWNWDPHYRYKWNSVVCCRGGCRPKNRNAANVKLDCCVLVLVNDFFCGLGHCVLRRAGAAARRQLYVYQVPGFVVILRNQNIYFFSPDTC